MPNITKNNEFHLCSENCIDCNFVDDCNECDSEEYLVFDGNCEITSCDDRYY